MLRELSRKIDRAHDAFERGLAWLMLVMVLVVFADVLMRYLFQRTYVWTQELEWRRHPVFAPDGPEEGVARLHPPLGLLLPVGPDGHVIAFLFLGFPVAFSLTFTGLFSGAVAVVLGYLQPNFFDILPLRIWAR